MPEPADRPPLRDQIAEALTTGRCCTGHIPRITDAVLHAIEAHIVLAHVDATQRADELAARLQDTEDRLRKATDAYTRLHAATTGAEATGDRWRTCAETAERQHAEALDQIATERRGRLTAEAAVRRAQALADRWSAALGVDIAHARALREALDAEGQQDDALAAAAIVITSLRDQRDQAIAALTAHAAEAHRRKWAHEDDNPTAFDALHRLGDEILASRDRLVAGLAIKQPSHPEAYGDYDPAVGRTNPMTAPPPEHRPARE